MHLDDIADITIDSLPPLFDQKIFAKVVGNSTAWAERMRWAKKGPPFLKVGGKVRYRREDVLDWLATCRKEVASGK